MGPITIFDKSFLQALSVNESVWFDNFFYPVICPIFYVETLADLSKTTRTRTPTHEVSVIAEKFPEIHGSPNIHHSEAALQNLLGNEVPMTGQILLARGQPVRTGQWAGYKFGHSQEAKAFDRWQNQEFYELEHKYARAWRDELESLDLHALGESLRKAGITGKSCRSLDDAKAIADSVVKGTDKPFDRIKLAVETLNVPRHLHETILKRWAAHNYPPLSKYAPYAAHVVTVDVFFQVALAANLISADRPSNHTDISYLYYLPFCSVFVSSDKLHKKCAPLFMRDNQSFAWGHDLKPSLSELNTHYLQLPDDVKEKGLFVFANYPPSEMDNLLTTIWDKHVPDWRERSAKPYESPKQDPELVEKMIEFTDAPSLGPNEVGFDHDEVTMMSVSRKIRKKKGDWWQLDKNMKNDDDD